MEYNEKETLIVKVPYTSLYCPGDYSAIRFPENSKYAGLYYCFKSLDNPVDEETLEYRLALNPAAKAYLLDDTKKLAVGGKYCSINLHPEESEYSMCVTQQDIADELVRLGFAAYPRLVKGDKPGQYKYNPEVYKEPVK